jgi:tRNA threonylcarbamoyl adenosine modification protein YeaZ
MKILALEFSSAQRSVAVVQGQPGQPPQVIGEAVETGGRAVNTFAMITEALRQAGLEREQIECLAVGLGPGSYTGIRAAIAVAQGWQLAREVKLLGISSVECLAAQARDQGIQGLVHLLIDAQRNEFYLAGYDLGPSPPLEAEPLHLVTLAEARRKAQDGAIFLGPEVSTWFSEARALFPRASTLGRLALTRREFLPGEKLEPIYLRETNFVKAPPPRAIPPPGEKKTA